MEACSEELASQGIHPLDLKNALVRLHPYSPTLIAQRGIRVGWVGKDHFIPTEQGVGILTPGPKRASGVLDARCVCLYDMHTACPKARHVHTNTAQRQAPNPLSFVFTLLSRHCAWGGSLSGAAHTC